MFQVSMRARVHRDRRCVQYGTRGVMLQRPVFLPECASTSFVVQHRSENLQARTFESPKAKT